MRRSLRKLRSYVRFPRDVFLTLISTLIGFLLGWGISDHYYRKSLSDLRADAEERKRVDELLFRGIESIGTIHYHRDATGKVVGVTIDLKGTAAANATATGTLGDAKRDQK